MILNIIFTFLHVRVSQERSAPSTKSTKWRAAKIEGEERWWEASRSSWKGRKEKTEVNSLTHVSLQPCTHTSTHPREHKHTGQQQQQMARGLFPLYPHPLPLRQATEALLVSLSFQHSAGVFADLVCTHLLTLLMTTSGLENDFSYYLSESTPGVHLALYKVLPPHREQQSTCMYCSYLPFWQYHLFKCIFFSW